MKKKQFKSNSSYDESYITEEKNNGDLLVEPGMAMSIAEIINAFRNGIPIPRMQPLYDDGEEFDMNPVNEISDLSDLDILRSRIEAVQKAKEKFANDKLKSAADKKIQQLQQKLVKLQKESGTKESPRPEPEPPKPTPGDTGDPAFKNPEKQDYTGTWVQTHT